MTIGLFLKEGGYYEGSNNYYCFNANWCINRCFSQCAFYKLIKEIVNLIISKQKSKLYMK